MIAVGLAVAIGLPADIAGFALAGVRLRSATSAAQVQAAWAELGPETTLVILTRAAAAALEPELQDPGTVLPLRVVMPE